MSKKYDLIWIKLVIGLSTLILGIAYISPPYSPYGRDDFMMLSELNLILFFTVRWVKSVF